MDDTTFAIATALAAFVWLTLIYVSVEQRRSRLRDFDQHGSEYPPNGDCLPIDVIALTSNGDANVIQ